MIHFVLHSRTDSYSLTHAGDLHGEQPGLPGRLLRLEPGHHSQHFLHWQNLGECLTIIYKEGWDTIITVVFRGF